MFSILRQPYPHSESPRKRLILSVAAGIFIAGFLDIFQPFGSSGWNNPYKLILLANFGLVTTAIMLGNFFMLTWLFPRFFKEENWTVGREIFFTVFNVLSIALGNILYGHYIGLFIIAGVGMLSMVSYTFLIGVFPSTGIAFINYIYHLKQYNHPPQPSVERVEKEDVLIKLIAENEKDSISLLSSELLFIESSDNYATLVYEKDGQVYKELIRSSLSRLEGQIDNPEIVRCHRSFIVNLSKVASVSGNAQGYKLKLKGYEMLVPVARKNSDIVKRL